MTEYKENIPQSKKNWTSGNENILKFLAICGCAFLGGYLAVCAVDSLSIPSARHNSFHTDYRHHNHYGAYHKDRRHHMPLPPNVFEEFDEFSNAQQRMIDDFFPGQTFERPYPKHHKHHAKDKNFAHKEPKFLARTDEQKYDPITIKTTDKGYSVIVDLSKFNNDEKNIQVVAKPESIKVSGKFESNTDNKKSSYTYTNYQYFQQKIAPNKMDKKVKDGKLIITLPYRK